MKNKPYKEVNTWKRHSIEVRFVNEDKNNKEVIEAKNFHKLNNLKKLSMHILLNGENVYRSKAGAFGISEIGHKLLERRGIFFKTVNKKYDVLNWEDQQEYEEFIKWVEHFRMSNQIQEAVKTHLMKTYLEEVESQDIVKPREFKHINLW